MASWRDLRKLEVRRLRAGELLLQGLGIPTVARQVGASQASVHRWKEIVRREGLEGLRSKRLPGRPRRLTPEQVEELVEIIIAGPRASGFPTERWTLAQVAQVIERSFGVKYHPTHIWRFTPLFLLKKKYFNVRGSAGGGSGQGPTGLEGG